MLRKRTLIFILVSYFISIFSVYSFAEGAKWQEAFSGLSGRILCMESLEGTDTLYAGTEQGLYRTENAGSSWERIDLPGSIFGVKDIALTEENIFIATSSGICVGGPRSPWRWLPGKKDIRGIASSFGEETDDSVLAWSENELFQIKGKSWELIGPGLLGKAIDDVAYRDGNMFVASGGDLFCSSGRDAAWGKISLLEAYDFEEEGDERYIDEEEEKLPMIGNIDPLGSERAAVATIKGIYIIDNSKQSFERIDTTGLPEANVRRIAHTGRDLFAATDKEVFLYSDERRYWQPVFGKSFPGDISFLKAWTDVKGRPWIWVAGEDYLYKRTIDFFPDAGGGVFGIKNKGLEPDIREVHQMAIEYAEVSPEKIKRWRSAARWKALMPKLSLDFSESVDENIEIYKSASKAYVVRGPQERGNDWGIDLSWDLSNLIWNSAQTSIDIRSKLMVQLRDNILEEVTRLYFERKRLLLESEEADEEWKDKYLLEKWLRIEELTAHIDALTGGEFSEALEGR
ncbi:WD40/YVTN/BNR-like repeat-containing protein [Candidatus Omnitrophota bacterium]